MIEGVDGLHVRFSCGFILNDERLLGRSDAAQALYLYLEALALTNRREFLPPEYTVKVLARRRGRTVKATAKAMASLKEGARPLVRQLAAGDGNGRIRVIGARKKHGERFRWKDERDQAMAWNEAHCGDVDIDVSAFAPVKVAGRPRKGRAGDEEGQEMNAEGQKTCVSDTPGVPETPGNERGTGTDTGTRTDTDTPTDSEAAPPPRRSGAASGPSTSVDAKTSKPPSGVPPTHSGRVGGAPGAATGKGTKDPPKKPAKKGLAKAPPTGGPPGFTDFLDESGRWRSKEPKARLTECTAWVRALCKKSYDSGLLALGHVFDVSVAHRDAGLKEPWTALMNRFRKLKGPSDGGTRWAKLMLNGPPVPEGKRGRRPPIPLGEAAVAVLKKHGFPVPGAKAAKAKRGA